MEKSKDLKIKKKFYEAYQLDKIFEGDEHFMQMNLLKFSPYEFLCTQEEEMKYFLFFVEGTAKVFKLLPNGKSFLVSFYNPFQIIGDAELISKKQAGCTIQALTACYALALPMEYARNELTQDRGFLKFALEHLGKKLEKLSVNSSINLLYPLENRLASYINTVAVRIETASSNGQLTFDENLTHLSELLGTSYRHLLRSLNSLCEKGVLKKEKRSYIIINKEKLSEIAGDLYQEVQFL